MSHQSELIATDIEAYLAEHERKELLRFITCGNVDDGKSTLIGRLLYDSKMIYEDTIAAIKKDTKRYGTTGSDFDPALLMDGLKEEREQGITIDVAYRYFSTAKRKFIIADTPGHVQYTRNMATGASTADLAVILVDARHGVREQTRRHSFITSLLGIKHIVVAVNKMDLVDWSQERFREIVADYQQFAVRLNIPDLHFIPLSAKLGDNVVDRSANMPWYDGATIMSFLESVYIGSDRNLEDFRFPVQWVSRPNLDFRGFAGTIASGIVRKGDEVMALPSRKTSRVKSIVTLDGDLDEAFGPLSVTLTLEDEIDVSRGDMLVRPGNVPSVTQKFDATVVWMHQDAMQPGKQYLFKQTTKTVPGTIQSLRYRVDVNTLHRQPAPSLGLNEIGRCSVHLSSPIMADDYRRNRVTGAFIIVDRLSNATVGAGMIMDRRTGEESHEHWDDEPATATLQAGVSDVTESERQARFGQKPATLLFTGPSGAGKSKLAYAVERRLFDDGRAVAVLEGKSLRLGISKDLEFSPEDRSENLRRGAEIARILNQAGLICLAPFASPQEEVREKAKELIGAERFLVVHMTAPAAVRDERVKERRASEEPAEAEEFAYEEPSNADLTLDTSAVDLAGQVDAVMELLRKRGFVE
ncbi:MAG TPA: sulfate adenylyltransferase subunit CysN [Pirellulaceae bacterium]|jgi:bifunctional enzyme CysN/CysC|nr:sulfate adenylyltransferase subunit CysN [Pirellulaceae bacterium]